MGHHNCRHKKATLTALANIIGHLIAGVAKLQRTISMRTKPKEATPKSGQKNRHFTSFSQPTFIECRFAASRICFCVCVMIVRRSFSHHALGVTAHMLKALVDIEAEGNGW